MNAGNVSEESERLRLLERGHGARTTGLVFDLIGYGLVVVGGALGSNQANAGLALSLSGSFVLTIGSVIGPSAYTVRQRGLTTAGYEVADSPQTTAWLLTILSVGLTGGSVLLSLRAQDQEDFGLALAAIGMGLGAGVLEVVNWSIREGRWNQALANSRRTSSAAYGQVRLFPLLRPRVRATDQSAGWLMGLGGRF